MRIWTMQPVEVYDKLLREVELFSDLNLSTLAEYNEFRVAYHYMKEQYEKQKCIPLGNKFLWWGWKCYNGKIKPPHLNHKGFFNTGVKAVRIEIEVPDNEVLLSDFDLWHVVLNNYYFDKTDNEEKEAEYYNSLSEVDKQIYNRSTWGEVFGVAGSDYIQAVFPVLRIGDVRGVTYFTAK